MPNIRSESIQVENLKWLGSHHGIYECPSGVVDVSTFTKNTHYPDGFLKSGLPLGRRASDDNWVLYNSAGSGGAEVLAGFLRTSQHVTGATGEKVNAPILQHGMVNVDWLPISLTVPTGVKQFTFTGAGA